MDLPLRARQRGLSLDLHIVVAVIGMAMPIMIATEGVRVEVDPFAATCNPAAALGSSI